MPKLATARPPVVKRSSGSRVTLPTRVTVLSAMGLSPLRCRGRPGRGGAVDHAAARGLGVGQADQLVADDLVREAERALEVVEGAGSGDEVEDHVVARRPCG